MAVIGGLKFGALMAGNEYTCGISTDALVYCYGLNEEAELGDGTFVNRATPTRVVSP